MASVWAVSVLGPSLSGMDNHARLERFFALLEARDWDAWAELLHPDVVYEVRQTRERARGREAYLRFNREFPGEWHLRPLRVVAEGDQGFVWFACRGAGPGEDDALAFFRFDPDGLVTEVVDFWPEPYDPPPGREHLVERR